MSLLWIVFFFKKTFPSTFIFIWKWCPVQWYPVDSFWNAHLSSRPGVFGVKVRCAVNAVLASARVCLRGQYGCWCSHWAQPEHVSLAQRGKTSPCSTGSLVEIAVLYEQNQISAVSSRHQGALFSPIGIWLLSRLCFIESIDHRFSLVPFSSRLCLVFPSS